MLSPHVYFGLIINLPNEILLKAHQTKMNRKDRTDLAYGRNKQREIRDNSQERRGGDEMRGKLKQMSRDAK